MVRICFSLIRLLVHILFWADGFLFYTLDWVLLLSWFISFFQNYPRFDCWEAPAVSCCILLNVPVIPLRAFLCYGTPKMFLAHLFSLLQSWNEGILSQSSGSFLYKNNIQKPWSRVRHSIVLECHWLQALSVNRARQWMSKMYVYTHTHTHLYLCLCLHVCIII